MDIIASMKRKLKGGAYKLVLPEGKDARIIKAARELKNQGYVSSVTLLGDPGQVELAAWEIGYNLEGILIEDPKKSKLFKSYTNLLYQARKHKNITIEQAQSLTTDPLYWGALMLKEGTVDAMVAGASCSTAKVLRAVLTVIGAQPDIRSVSSFNIMRLPDRNYGADGHLLFADCAIIPDPSSEQLADITIVSAESFATFFSEKPRIALLSFSTLGSASHHLVDKVRTATEIVKRRKPDLLIDGELQFDAALIPEVAHKKAPGSPVAGKANILIFPDLNAANIGYKIVQRLAHADVYGPCIQGLAKPVSDLSRGCSAEDIVNTAVITLTQARQKRSVQCDKTEPVFVSNN